MEISYEDACEFIRIEKYKEIAEDYLEMIEDGAKARWEKIVKAYEGSGLDPVDERPEEVEKIQMYEYRMKLMTLCCMWETFEQDLYNYLLEKNIIQSRNNDYSKSVRDYNNKFPNNKLVSDKDDESIKKNDPIYRMRKIVNAIKHGNGASLDAIVEIFGDDILADSNLGYIDSDGTEKRYKQRKFDENILTSINLKIDGKIEESYKIIEKFWKKTFAEYKKQNPGRK